MFFLMEISMSVTAVFFAAIGEPIELFAFGAGLVVTVGVIRWLAGKNSVADSSKDEIHDESVTNS